MDEHYARVTKAILAGRVIPFLGAGASLCDRPSGSSFRSGCTYLPSGSELASYLAESFGYPALTPENLCPLCKTNQTTSPTGSNDSTTETVQCPLCKSDLRREDLNSNTSSQKHDLVRVSQFAAVMNGDGPLYEELHKLFNIDYQITSLHKFLAALPSAMRAHSASPTYQLIVTTNYDDMLERAFRDVDEEFDLVSYIATRGEHRGMFLHTLPDGSIHPIDRPDLYLDLSLQRRTVILKIHGAINRGNSEQDSYVITEDDYIDFLTRVEFPKSIPITLAAKLRKSHFLFLGYSLRDWNLRVILQRIWGEQKLTYKSWSIQLDPDEVEREFWNKRGVEILNLPLEEYISALSERLLQSS